MPNTTPAELDLNAIAETSRAASVAWATTSPWDRARALVAVADALDASEGDLIAIAEAETGLTTARLTGELKRTIVQLCMFADIVVDGAHLDVRIDDADPGFVLGPRADLRRYLVPLGPVLNFAASNFPFAFSVAGGDTTSALAAGCAVIVKAHSGHPRLSLRTAEVVSTALDVAGAPAGLLQTVSGQKAGVDLLQDPRIAAGSFTGSIRVGRMLADLAAARPVPIPFFGELGSVNPAFVTSAALDERAEQIADGLVTSVSASAGQLCTKPGFVFTPRGGALGALVADRISDAEHRLLNPGITSGYSGRRDSILGTTGVEVIAEGGLRIDADGQGWASPTIVRVSAQTLLAEREHLLDEAFGPLTVLVEYGRDDSLIGLADALFEGNLTGTVHAGKEEDSAQLRSLLDWIAGHAGRVVYGGWPTGVTVTAAQQHGGPWPATTNDSGTSVGGAAIARFMRPVAYQDCPQRLLPLPLRDDNPWGVPQRRSPAGESLTWGEAFRSR